MEETHLEVNHRLNSLKYNNSQDCCLNILDKTEKIREVVDILSNISEDKKIENINQNAKNKFIGGLLKFDIETIMDNLILLIGRRISSGRASLDDLLPAIHSLLDVNPETFKTLEDLKNRYNYLKAIGLDKISIPSNYKEVLKNNHINVINVFDNFNKLIEDSTKIGMDYFYTGGMLAYLGTDTDLQRMHGDIDIYINIKDLEKLQNMLQESHGSGFQFVDNIQNKGLHGHEYLIKYKDNPITIGIFLFEKGQDGQIYRVEYDNNGNRVYNKIPVGDVEIEIGEFNGTQYKRQSLRSIYESKIGSSRLKDKHDLHIIDDYLSNQKYGN